MIIYDEDVAVLAGEGLSLLDNEDSSVRDAVRRAFDNPLGDDADSFDVAAGLEDLRRRAQRPRDSTMKEAAIRPPDVATADSLPAAMAVRAARQTRWQQVRNLDNPSSRLGNAAHIEFVLARPGERTVPSDRAALTPGEDGVIHLAYHLGPNGWAPPTVFVRLRNTTDRPLYCALLALSEDYRIHAGLFPGQFISAQGVSAALNGRPLSFSLPSGKLPEPGEKVRDWLKMIIAEEKFGSRSFEQPSDALDARGVLDQLDRMAVTQDEQRSGAYDWATSITSVLTVVPT